jgi:thiamine pyrophosphate-dependent acetolactate synthase large subunit-like protein
LDVHTPDEIAPVIQRALNRGAPCFMERMTPGEHEVMPTVAGRQRMAKDAAKQS